MEIQLSEHDISVLKKRAEEKGAKSAEEYVASLLRQIVSKIEDSGKGSGAEYSAEEQEKIKQRLQSLGYID